MAQVTFLSLPSQMLLIHKGKPRLVLVVLRCLGNLPKFTIRGGEIRGVSAEQTSLPVINLVEKHCSSLFPPLHSPHVLQAALPPAVQRQLVWGLHCKHDQLTDLGLKITLFFIPLLKLFQ